MIEAKFGLFQVEKKDMFGYALERVKPGFGEAPKRLDAVDVRCALHEFVPAVADAKVAVEADVHQPVIAAPAVGVDHRGGVNFAAYDGLKRLF